MNQRISIAILLSILGITNAYLLSHPNLIGKVGIIVYRYDYIRTFPRALLTVSMVLLVAIAISEALNFWASKPVKRAVMALLSLLALFWFVYIYQSFSGFSYRMTGKSFIYGAHLLPMIVLGIFLRYLIKSWLRSGEEKL
ncbi:hypothetical protein [Dyadobacter tibetensis]|uniref:hypothetical protein n=1 Tax=Dyadobacter tibetensis TaxID=1211851 RepID=UPI00047093BD|nr:hypothetical protein [Dyadobacter tibetensis]